MISACRHKFTPPVKVVSPDLQIISVPNAPHVRHFRFSTRQESERGHRRIIHPAPLVAIKTQKYSRRSNGGNSSRTIIHRSSRSCGRNRVDKRLIAARRESLERSAGGSCLCDGDLRCLRAREMLILRWNSQDANRDLSHANVTFISRRKTTRTIWF